METNDPDNPGYRLNGEHVQRSRLRVDARKWRAAKMANGKYGERLELAGDQNSPHDRGKNGMPEISIPNNWDPRAYQMELWRYLWEGGKRAVVRAHRRWGGMTCASTGRPPPP